MGAGGPGDDFIKDITYFKMEVFGPVCDGLIIELHELVGRDRLYKMIDWPRDFSPPKRELDKLEQQLRDKIKESK